MSENHNMVTPKEVGYDASRLQVLDRHFQRLIDEERLICGVYCLAREGRIFAQNAIGHQSYDLKNDTRPVRQDTIFRIASITKIFTAIAIFRLVEDGRIRLNQPIADFIPEFKEGPFQWINIVQLLSHTSGFPADPGIHKSHQGISPWKLIDQMRDANWIKSALHMGVINDTDKEWAYSTFGYVFLGEVISRVSGVFAEDYIMEHIVKPCEMVDTGFHWDKEKVDRYMLRSEREARYYKEIKEGASSEKDDFWDSLHMPDTGAGLHSTSSDLIKFTIMLEQKGRYKGKRILGRKAWEKMTSMRFADMPNYCWGNNGVGRPYGHGVDRSNEDMALYSPASFYHEGYGTCCSIVDPDEKLSAVWFAQFYDDKWSQEFIAHVQNIIWSGLE